MLEAPNEEVFGIPLGERDCWPFVRMLIVVFSLAVASYQWLGWRLDVRRLLGLPGQMFGVLSILALISFALAEIYLLLFAIPLYVLAVLNDGFYGLARWVCRRIFRIRSVAWLTILGLCGEMILFGVLAVLIRRVFHGT